MLLLALLQFVAPWSVGTAAASIDTWNLKRVALPTNDVVYDAGRDVLLATVSELHPSLGNELVELDPETGELGRHVFVGSSPTAIALTDDGSTAYLGLRGANRIAQVDLATFTLP